MKTNKSLIATLIKHTETYSTQMNIPAANIKILTDHIKNIYQFMDIESRLKYIQKTEKIKIVNPPNKKIRILAPTPVSLLFKKDIMPLISVIESNQFLQNIIISLESKSEKGKLFQEAKRIYLYLSNTPKSKGLNIDILLTTLIKENNYKLKYGTHLKDNFKNYLKKEGIK